MVVGKIYMYIIKQKNEFGASSSSAWNFALSAFSIANKLTKTLCSNGDLDSDLLDFISLINVKYAKIGRCYRSSRKRPELVYLSKACQFSTATHKHSFDVLSNPLLAQIPVGAKIGSVWTLCDIEEELDDLSQWSRISKQLGVEDIAVIILDADKEKFDVLELYLDTPATKLSETIANRQMRACNIFESAWRQRTEGSVERLFATHRKVENNSNVVDAKALHHDNPYGLTRAEFSVCRHLLTGASVSLIAKRMDVRPNTVRTHLSKTFQKTGTNRQSELILFLMSGFQLENLHQMQSNTAS